MLYCGIGDEIMTKWIKVLAVATMLAAAALSVAQGGGRGQGRGGRGRGNVSELQLVMRADVQADIKVTEDEKIKLDALQTKIREARRANGGGGGGQGGGGGAPDMEAMRARMQAQAEEQHKQLAEILTPEQLTRVGEIRLQVLGPRALADAKIQKDLGLSDDQVAKIKDLTAKQQEASRDIRDKVQAGSMTREEATALNQKNQKTLGEEYAKVLTPAQADKFKAMQGAPFKADEPQSGA